MPINIKTALERKIEAKRQEIAELETKIRECHAFLQGLQEAMKVLPRDPNETETTPREGSNVAKARELLQKHGKPMHVRDLLKAMGKEINRNNSSSLGASIITYVRRGEIFTKTGANTFGLIEFSEQKKPFTMNDVPDDFGTDEEDGAGESMPA